MTRASGSGTGFDIRAGAAVLQCNSGSRPLHPNRLTSAEVCRFQ
jgi:hypothetical protein